MKKSTPTKSVISKFAQKQLTVTAMVKILAGHNIKSPRDSSSGL